METKEGGITDHNPFSENDRRNGISVRGNGKDCSKDIWNWGNNNNRKTSDETGDGQNTKLQFTVRAYSFEKTEFGVKGRKKINANDIKLDIAVDKVIDWSSGKEYPLPADVFKKSNMMDIVESHEENKGLGAKMAVAPIEDIILMKLMTERPRDHFDAIAMIIDSFDKIDLPRFAKICKESGLRSHIRDRLESVLADTKKGLTKKLWREQTEREFIREQEVALKDRVNRLREAIGS